MSSVASASRITARLAAVGALAVVGVTSTLASTTGVPSSVGPSTLARVDGQIAGTSFENPEPTFTASANAAIVIPDPNGLDVGMPRQFPPERISGFDMDSVVVVYDDDTDVLTVSIVGFGIVGDADGDGDPSGTDPILADLGGVDVADFGAEETFALQLDVDEDGTFDVIAGVSVTSGDMSSYRLAQHSGFASNSPAFDFAYGSPLSAHDGGVPASPSASSPDLTVSIASFSTLADTLQIDDDSLDFGLNAFVGSLAAAGIGDDFLPDRGAQAPVDLDARLGDFVWLDDDLDGVQAADEPGVGGVIVSAIDIDGNTVASTTTDADGFYEFAVRPGVYRIRVEAPAGHSFTTQGVGSPMDSDVSVITGESPAVTVVQGEEQMDLDAGLIEHLPSIDIEKATNGDDADSAPGALLQTGSEVEFTYVITNTGNIELFMIDVTDDVLGDICTIDRLDIGESVDCDARAIVTPGAYRNVGTAVGTPIINGERLVPVEDRDPSHHRGSFDPAIDLEKSTNGIDADDAPGPEFSSGTDVTFTYVVRNVGNVDLINVVVTDDLIGQICTVPRLAIGAATDCSALGTVEPGPYVNVGTVTGSGVFDGVLVGDVTDVDLSHHHGTVSTGVTIEKATNGDDADVGPGPLVLSGSTVTFTYVVTNTGNVPLHDVIVSDDQLGPICVVDVVEVDDTNMCTATTTAAPGPYMNLGTVVATPMVQGAPQASVTDTDPSHHSGTLDPAVDIEKSTDGVDADVAPGPALRSGDEVTWTYVVTNTGNVALTDIVVFDDVEGEICTVDTLTPGATASCEASGIVAVGQYENLGVVTAIPVFANVALLPVGDSDPSHHVGQLACVPDIQGPLMWAGAITEWDSGLVAAPGSTIRIFTHEPDSSPGQPHEQVYVIVGGVTYGPTPEGLGTIDITVGAGGPVSVVHWSVITGDVANPNSVAFAICGSDLS